MKWQKSTKPAIKTIAGRYRKSVMPIPSNGLIEYNAYGDTPYEANRAADRLIALNQLYDSIVECIQVNKQPGLTSRSVDALLKLKKFKL